MKLPIAPKVCAVCGKVEHTSPGNMGTVDLFSHRITEFRDCEHYEGCLGEVARADGIFVPCIYCVRYPKEGEI